MVYDLLIRETFPQTVCPYHNVAIFGSELQGFCWRSRNDVRPKVIAAKETRDRAHTIHSIVLRNVVWVMLVCHAWFARVRLIQLNIPLKWIPSSLLFWLAPVHLFQGSGVWLVGQVYHCDREWPLQVLCWLRSKNSPHRLRTLCDTPLRNSRTVDQYFPVVYSDNKYIQNFNLSMMRL